MWKALGMLRAARLHCSFCGRSEAEVARLVAGASAYICDACTAACVSVFQDHGGFDVPRPDRGAGPASTR
jgi:ATP-dependent Clp protease ATP-binding subunit ClpX